MAFWSKSAKKNGICTVVKEEGCVWTFAFDVPEDKMAAVREKAFQRLQSVAVLPGFRAGKVPLDLVKKNFADKAKNYIIESLAKEFFPEAIREHELSPVNVPLVHDLEFKEKGASSFQVTIECAPKFIAQGYKNIAVKNKETPVNEADLASALSEVRQRAARLEAVSEEVVGKDHLVVIDYEGAADGKPLEGAKGRGELVDMSAPQTVAGLVDGIVGAKKGETRDVAVELPGKQAIFKVKIVEIKRKLLPGIDDELAKDFGFAGLAAMKTKIREQLEQERKAAARREFDRQIEKGLLDINNFAVPPSVVEPHLEFLCERYKTLANPGRNWTDKEGEEIRGRLRPQAESEVRLSYILRDVARQEKLEVTEQDFQAEVEKACQAVEPQQAAAAQKYYAERREQVVAMLQERKVMQFIRDSAKIEV
ncbi:MAG: trigger factor [Elusimicrobia bacterium]|nr:trigger factor [Elusimicrobiota bacterium]